MYRNRVPLNRDMNATERGFAVVNFYAAIGIGIAGAGQMPQLLRVRSGLAQRLDLALGIPVDDFAQRRGGGEVFTSLFAVKRYGPSRAALALGELLGPLDDRIVEGHLIFLFGLVFYLGGCAIGGPDWPAYARHDVHVAGLPDPSIPALDQAAKFIDGDIDNPLTAINCPYGPVLAVTREMGHTGKLIRDLDRQGINPWRWLRPRGLAGDRIKLQPARLQAARSSESSKLKGPSRARSSLAASVVLAIVFVRIAIRYSDVMLSSSPRLPVSISSMSSICSRESRPA